MARGALSRPLVVAAVHLLVPILLVAGPALGASRRTISSFGRRPAAPAGPNAAPRPTGLAP